MARVCWLISAANTSHGKAPIPASYRARRSLNYTLITSEEPGRGKGRGWFLGWGGIARPGPGSWKCLISARGCERLPLTRLLLGNLTQ